MRSETRILRPLFTIRIFLLCLIALFLHISSVNATHLLAFEINYEHLGNNVFEVTLIYYRDCAGVTEPVGPITINLKSIACNQNVNISCAKQPDPIGGPEVSPMCVGALTTTTCSGGTNPGIERYYYKGTIDLQSNFCDDWVFSYADCCRSNAIDNLASLGNQYVETTMNNEIVAGDTIWNNSPTFTSLPTPYICINQPYNHSQGTIEIDGDSLSFSIINSLSAAGLNIGFAAGYSLSDPIISSPSITIDPLTGHMTMKPTLLQYCALLIKVEEWRQVNGTMIQVGTAMHEMLISVFNCTNVQPALDSIGIQGIVGGVKIDSFEAEVQPEDSVSFFFVAIDANGNNQLLTTNLGPDNMPDANFSYSCICPVDTGYFGWRPTIADTGLHTMTVTAQDDGCPILGGQSYSVVINVTNTTYAGEDQYYCGTPIQLEAVGGSQFTWSIVPGGDPIDTTGGTGNFSCNPCRAPIASPSITTSYIVTSNLPPAYGNIDTVTVTVVPSFTLNACSDTAICIVDSATLYIPSEDTTYSSYTYSWTPGGTLSSSSQSTTNAFPTTTTAYYVSAEALPGCIKYDSVIVTVDTMPIVTTMADSNICAGDTIQLTTIASAGVSYVWSPANTLYSPVSNQPDTLPQPYAIPDTSTLYTVIVDGLGCKDTASMTAYLPVVTADTVGQCDLSDSVQLLATVANITPPSGGGSISTCGVNGTTAGGTIAGYNVLITGGTWNSDANPFLGTETSGARVQLLYRASDMISAGMSANGNVITKIGFMVSNAMNETFTNYTVKMSCTPVWALTSNAWESPAGLTTVFSGDYTVTGPGMNKITLQNTFDWDGSSRLLIDICFTGTSPGIDDAWFDYNSVMGYNGGMQGTGAGCASAAGAAITWHPVIQFTAGEAPGTFTYSWSPGTNMDDPTSSTPKVKILTNPTTYTVLVTGGSCPAEDDLVARCDGCESTPPQMAGDDTAIFITPTTFDVVFSEPILCSSVDSNGGDFYLDCTGSTTFAACDANSIVSATTINCNNDTSSKIRIKIANPIPIGYDEDWIIKVDSMSGITDTCNNVIQQSAKRGMGFAVIPNSSGVALPIDLLYLKAKINNNGSVTIMWQGVSEINARVYEVQRSVDGVTFIKIGARQAAGAPYVYELLDPYPELGINYYRILRIDHDYNYGYSNIIAVKITGVNFELISIKPNPTKDKVTYTFNSNRDDQVEVEVVDLLNRTILIQSIIAAPGKNESVIDISEVRTGIYLLRLRNHHGESTLTKLVKQ